jgi:hypothetical protein
MAGSYNHIVDGKGRFRGVSHLDNLGDAYEALEECYGMIHYLANYTGAYLAIRLEHIEEARRNYKRGLLLGGTAVEEQ